MAQAIERDPHKLAEFEKPAFERLLGVLTEAQRTQITDLLGKTFQGKLSPVAVDLALEPRRSTAGTNGRKWHWDIWPRSRCCT